MPVFGAHCPLFEVNDYRNFVLTVKQLRLIPAFVFAEMIIETT